MNILPSSRLRIIFFVLVIMMLSVTVGYVKMTTFAHSSSASVPKVTGASVENQIVFIAKQIQKGAYGTGRTPDVCVAPGRCVQYSWLGGHSVKPGLSEGSCEYWSRPKEPVGAPPYSGPNCTSNSGLNGTIGLDCSGFTRLVYDLAYGKDVLGKNSAKTQIVQPGVSEVADGEQQPGDLVYFANDNDNEDSIYHVGIYIGNVNGNAMMIDAPHSYDKPSESNGSKWVSAFVRTDKVKYFGTPFGYYRYTPQFTSITGQFRLNPNNSGPFDATQPVVFSESFQTINFNPDPSSQKCSSGTGVDEYTRPFTDISSSADGKTCQTIIAQNHDHSQQAGLNNLYNFQTDFLATITVPSAGTLTSSITADDGFIYAVGKNADGVQPTGNASNPFNNAPESSPLKGYQVIAANNQPAIANPYTIITTFPAAGTYPVELDYTECDGGRLTFVVSNQSFNA